MSDTTAIDILLEPDAAMLQHAQAANARLLKAFPKGYALDVAHRPHISCLQRLRKDRRARKCLRRRERRAGDRRSRDVGVNGF